MKFFLSRSFVLSIVMILTFSSCEETHEGIEETTLPVASQSIHAVFNNWSGSSSGRVNTAYSNVSEVYEAYNENMDQSLFGALNPDNPNESILFTVENGEVSHGMITEVTSSDQGVEIKVFDLDRNLRATILDLPDGTRQVTAAGSENGRTEGWFDKFDDCVGKFHNPSGCNICDYAFVAVADAATMGLYSAFSLPVCAVVGLA